MRKRQKKIGSMLLHTAAKQVQSGAQKIRQQMQKTANDVASEPEPQNYPQQTLQDGIMDIGITAASVTKQSARVSYTKYRDFQQKRAGRMGKTTGPAEGIQQNPVEHTSTHLGFNHPQKKSQQLRVSHIKNQTIQRHMAEKRAFVSLVGSGTVSIPVPGIESFGKAASRLLEKLKRLAEELIHAAIPTLTAFFPAVFVVVLLVLFFGIVAAVLGSPMGILFAGESNDPNAIPISVIVQETNRDFGQAINDIITAHPECTQVEMHYDYPEGTTWASDWPEVLAVFAVNTNLNNDQDVIVIDEQKKQQLQDTFWLMHSLNSTVETIVTEIEVPDEAENDTGTVKVAHTKEEEKKVPKTHTEIQTSYTLHITVSSKTIAELESTLAFNQDQRDILQQLLSDEMRPYLVSLVGTGTSGVPGTLQWPLPGYTYISTQFGVPDAFGRPGHKGIDIPALAGTPILAAHSGTVRLAATSTSYGNQVMVDSGDGLTTRYAHMITYIVTPGQSVTTGEVLGYVGSTGASTGNHLHFEVMRNDVLVDPLSIFA